MWSLYKNNKKIKPLKFSNGKTQEDIVNEVLNSIQEGHKIIFIHGKCGTGKSAIALNVAKELGKTSIVVPGKSLQSQYKKDYENDMYLIKQDKKLKISVITGRNNHECLFLKENKKNVPKIKKEINSSLNDIFEFDSSQKKEQEKDLSADNYEIPCKIEIKERNFRKLKDYLKQNSDVRISNINKINDVKRLPLASICPYWSPVIPEHYEPKNLDYDKKRTYEGLNNTKFSIYQRKPGCKFYEQFNSYIDSDAIVFNSLKYKLESVMNRKPLTEAEIIDECDEFLDSFTNQKDINIDRLQNSLIQIENVNQEFKAILEEIYEIIKQIRKNKDVRRSIFSKDVIPLKETGIYDIFRILIDSKEIAENIDEEDYLFEILESAKMFENFFDETYVLFNKRDRDFFASVVTTNLAKKFKEMVEKNKRIVLMSGTLHSENILRDIFGIEDFKIIDAETEQPGKIEVFKTGLEFDCKHENFNNGNFSRKQYLRALEECVTVAEKPALVHVSAFYDLPSEEEIRKFKIINLISREKLREIQKKDKEGNTITRFKKGEMNVLFTTKCARGIDFPGDECRSIIFTKYPNPHPDKPFWKILRKTKPHHYWAFYKDKARRELLQRVYRGLRFKEDHVFLLSPDLRVLNSF